MRVLVTGASGFAGKHATAALAAAGHTCIPLGGPGDTVPGIDITDARAVAGAAAAADPGAIMARIKLAKLVAANLAVTP